MKHKTFGILTLVFLALIVFGFINKSGQNKKYEYMQISQRYKTIYISSNAGFSERKVGECHDDLDAVELMKIAEDYQKSGWDVVNAFSTVQNNSSLYHNILLKKSN
jgi:hypothetical protein